MDRRAIRKMIQQEISRVREDYIVPPQEVPDDFKRRQGLPAFDPSVPQGTSSHGCGEDSEKSLTCSACGNPLVMEGGCGCDSSSYDKLFDPTMGYEVVMTPPEPHGHKKRGAYMAKSQLHKIEKYARELQEMIPEGTDLDDWMRSHISQASDDLSEVYHKLEYKSHES
jgi:hypothetical protein